MVTGDERQLLSYLGPNWFASVMGTGIVATAAATLPVHVPGLRVFAQVVWVIAALWMVILIVTVGANWLRATVGCRSQLAPTVTMRMTIHSAAITHTTCANTRRPETWTGRVAAAVATMPVPITDANQFGPR